MSNKFEHNNRQMCSIVDIPLEMSLQVKTVVINTALEHVDVNYEENN